MFEHLHAGDHVILARLLDGQFLGADFAVCDIGCLGFQRMQLRDTQCLGRKVDAQHLGATSRHRIGQDSATTPHIHNGKPLQRTSCSDPVQPQRIDLVQWTKFAVLVPPAMGQI